MRSAPTVPVAFGWRFALALVIAVPVLVLRRLALRYATAPVEPPPYTEDDFLNACAKECRNCPYCGNPPCDGCCAGGICDQADCRCDCDEYEPFDYGRMIEAEDEEFPV